MRVLIAEDDANLSAGLSALLTEEGFTCETVANGSDALAAFEREPHPIVVLDVVMPERDGLSVCRAIREARPDTQILLLSARGDEHDRVLGLDLGADDYMAKPFGPRELVARVKTMARRSRNDIQSDGVFTLHDLTVDPGALTASRGEDTIPLTPREVQLLQVMHAHPGRALSRDALFDAGWGRDYYANSRALDQYISALRHKIEVDPAQPRIIATVRGVGYRYDP